MAATHPRRKRSETRVESTSYELISFVETLVNADLPVKTVILKILTKRGPYTPAQLVDECKRYGKITTTRNSVVSALRELRALGLVVKHNGGYAIWNWMEIGA